jgi:hypothetical protein
MTKLEELTKKTEGLNKALSELNDYRNAVKAATFPGKSIEDAAKLLKFLNDNYTSLHAQFMKSVEEGLELEKQAEAESKLQVEADASSDKS